MTTTIGGFPIDSVISVRRTKKAEVSKYPVERGTALTDTKRVEEPDLELECVVSDTPIGAIAEHPTRAGVKSPSADALQVLDDLQNSDQPIVVECSLGRFESMVVTNLSVTRDVKTRKALKFTIQLSRIRIEDNERIRVAAIPTGVPNFGLSIDRLKNGSHLLWRKGKPPGSGPGDDPPGVIIGQEVVECRNKNIFHADGKALNNQEAHDILLDMQRDAQLLELRALKRAELKQKSAGERIDNAQKLLDRKFPSKPEAAGANPDPAMFGKRGGSLVNSLKGGE